MLVLVIIAIIRYLLTDIRTKERYGYGYAEQPMYYPYPQPQERGRSYQGAKRQEQRHSTYEEQFEPSNTTTAYNPDERFEPKRSRSQYDENERFEPKRSNYSNARNSYDSRS
ncbi:MAG: hypothetical protein COU47_01405 [Candidatus Niyogibacteria bacterium CG10_big_fil_rev_8_21_14_0_10_46_36]|uniref:Uncharacterized protein n=1 Tax=Candidatus Niyogibacteria bacterium CG10_big_fil_rev_8_21_14_0_10_46_36 TaxID=1974726 RepID=A0A2H0TDV3_9BACT|nr:MAG: hypothetical protein COU47_01405 [Candidatus Niyogibacteria bacterium CG10_big_fil_rev_8_21_14_0_10_46_36]